MAEFQHILVSICLFLPALSASAFDKTYCSNDSLVDLKTKLQGVIVFPSTTVNFTGEQCQVEIRSPMDSKTKLTLINLRLKSTEVCSENSVVILAHVLNNYSVYTFCESVGSMETLTLKSTIIEMMYTASLRNELRINGTKDAVSVHYKRIDSTKACRHVLNGANGEFETFGYPSYPLQGECEWVISTDKLGKEKTIIEFKILYFYRLNCESNFIEVRQGGSIAAPAWKKICTADQSTRIVSSASKLWIRIKSSLTDGIGFHASYKIQTCQVVTADKQLDFNSQTGSSCKIWNLTASHGHIVALSFSQFNLVSEDTTSCSGSFIEIWDGKTKTAYCNSKQPPSIIMSKGRKMIVTYRSEEIYEHFNSFGASFTSILSSSFKTNCFVHEKKLSFKCNTGLRIPCAWQCDGAMQCSDNSDEKLCSKMQARWHKLEVFVIVMGCICASTVTFCVGMVCFRKCLVSERSSSSRHSRGLSITDQSPLTPNADLPSPPPCYFSDQDEEPPAAVIRGTYFFGDEFSQSGIHSASLFGIPPPRYRSTESLHQSSTGARSIWQRSISSIPLASTEETRNNGIVSFPEEDPPGYDSLSADKDEQITTCLQLHQNSNMPLEPEACLTENPENLSSELAVDYNHLGNGMPIELHVPSTSFSNECVADNFNSDLGIGRTNTGAMLNV